MRLGPFEIHSQVGEGGMGRVFRASHVSEPVEVAIKVLTGERARDARYLEAFAREVRAVAAMDHPGIVAVHDFGRITPEFESDSDGEFVAGSPYLVMDLIEGGTLASRARSMNWREFRAALLMTLDALAHAHARGLIHRDLKPNNIMVDAADARSGLLKLTDFGLAHALPVSGLGADEEQPEERVAGSNRRIIGTPTYMAPEQIEGRDRELGPWTDLYALGCLAYRLATGAPPFVHTDRVEILRSHLREKPPAFAPRFACPVGLRGWLDTLLRKDPMGRFTRAADAAYALLQIPEGEWIDPVRTSNADFPEDGTTLLDVPLSDASVSLTHEWLDEPRTGRDFQKTPPLPSTWRLDRSMDQRMPLGGAGLGLYGLRSIRLVGRGNELDYLWNSLRIVASRGESRAVALTGGPGVGKSRIAQTLTERAHEVGAAHILTAHYAPEPPLISPIAAMIRDFVRAGSLRRNGVLGRLRQFLPGGVESDQLFEMLALSEMIAPGTGGAEDTRFTLTSMDERYTAVAKFIEGLTRDRPVVVWIDDGHWSIEAIGFAAYLAQSDLPVLTIITIRDDVMASRDYENALLENVLEDTPLERLEVPPLDDDDQEELVKTLLGLEDSLARQVLQRADGNPLFAIQLVGDWVDRGALMSSPNGFRLKPGEKASIPDDIHEVWVRRVDEVRDEFQGAEPERIVAALETAAALGERIDIGEWLEVISDMEVPVDFVEHLTEMRLAAINDDETWSFVHGMFRESIARRAVESQRWAQAHLRCVRGLERHHRSIWGGVAQRAGQHYYEAGEYRQALEPLERAAVGAFSEGEFQRGLRLLSLREEAMLAASIPQTDQSWADSFVLRARMLFGHGDIEGARGIIEEIERISGPLGWKIQRKVHWLKAIICVRTGELREARELFVKALEATDAEEVDFYADVVQGLGAALSALGEADEAIARYEQSIELFGKTGRLVGIGNAHAGIAQMLIGVGDFEQAAERLEESKEAFEEAGNRVGLSRTLNDIGDLHRDQRRLDEAERHYRAAQRLMEATGSAYVGVPMVNRAFVLLARDEAEAALELAERARRRLIQHEVLGIAGYTHLVPLVVHAESGAIEHFRSVFETFVEFLESGNVDRDIAEFALRAGSAALRNGWEETTQLYQISRDQFAKLGDSVRAEEVAELLELI